MHLRRSATHFEILVTSLAFALTGVGTAILGAVLPALLAAWHLTDRRGGTLLFLAFAGSTLGAALTERPHRLVPAGGLLVCSSGTALAYLFGAPAAPAGFLLYGLGLGITMTAISLLRSQAVGVVENHHEMNRLNLLWALGACCAPPLALHSLQHASMDDVLRTGTLLLLVSASAMAVAAAPRNAVLRPIPRTRQSWAPFHLCLFAATAVALETAIGSWLTAYTQRRTHGASLAIFATAVFWLGLLLSRLLHSFRMGGAVQSRRSVLLHVGCVVFASTLLTAAPATAVFLPAALLAGWGLGPLYPLALSLALPHYRSAAVFVAAGLGSSLLPWLTGALSTTFHSLRAGMLAPCFAVILLLISCVSIRAEIQEQIPEPA